MRPIQHAQDAPPETGWRRQVIVLAQTLAFPFLGVGALTAGVAVLAIVGSRWLVNRAPGRAASPGPATAIGEPPAAQPAGVVLPLEVTGPATAGRQTRLGHLVRRQWGRRHETRRKMYDALDRASSRAWALALLPIVLVAGVIRH